MFVAVLHSVHVNSRRCTRTWGKCLSSSCTALDARVENSYALSYSLADRGTKRESVWGGGRGSTVRAPPCTPLNAPLDVPCGAEGAPHVHARAVLAAGQHVGLPGCRAADHPGVCWGGRRDGGGVQMESQTSGCMLSAHHALFPSHCVHPSPFPRHLSTMLLIRVTGRRLSISSAPCASAVLYRARAMTARCSFPAKWSPAAAAMRP